MLRPEATVHWEEGMLIRPHHFQALSRTLDYRFAQSAARGPAWWGIRSLEIDEGALLLHQISVLSAEVILRDGTMLRIPETARLKPRNFEAAFKASGYHLDVFLGVPMRVPGESVISSKTFPDRRFLVDDSQEVPDENTGDSPQPLSRRRLNARLILGGESTEGYETIHLARLLRRGATTETPVRDSRFFPAPLGLEAHPAAKELVEGVRDAVLATAKGLANDLGSRPGSAAMNAGGDAYMKLMLVNQYGGMLRQLCHVDGVHPFDVYVTLSGLAEALATFTGQRRCPELSLYEHDDVGPALHEVCTLIRDYLDYVYSTSYEVAAFEPRAANPRHLEATLRDAWLDSSWQLYVGVAYSEDAPRSAEDLFGLFRYPEGGERGQTSIKLVADNEETKVLNSVIQGLVVASLVQLPPSLPPLPNIYYFRIDQATTNNDRWAALQEARKVTLGWLREPDPDLKFFLYAGQVKGGRS